MTLSKRTTSVKALSYNWSPENEVKVLTNTVKPHLMATSVIWRPHYFWPPGKKAHTFPC